ncbi:MAG: hypothetical protein ABFD49_08660 [Armatimonadota bacterium]|nr:hypothetical protein [bacterium]
MPFLERIQNKLAKYGEEYTVTGGTFLGIFKLLNSSTMSTYLDDVEEMAVSHPGLLLITEGEADIDVDDRLTRDRRTYTVLRVSQHRIGNATMVKIAILA